MRKFSIISESFETGEYVTGIFLNYGDFKDLDISKIKVDATLKSEDILKGKVKTSEVQRDIASIDYKENSLTINLVYEPTHAHKDFRIHCNSLEGYRLEIDGETFECEKIINPAVDKFEDAKREVLSYRIFRPQSDKPAPLMVWLHGIGEVGTDNRLQIANNSVVSWADEESQKCFGDCGAYIVAPQCRGSSFNTAEVKGVIDEVIAQNNVDTNRIYIGGCSMGGYGSNQMISAYPDLFAAAIPVCPADAIRPEIAKKLAENKVPVYYVHCIEDPSACTVANSLLSVQRIREAGGCANAAIFDRVITEHLSIPMGGHSVWIYVHNNFSGVGDNSQGRNFHKGEFTMDRTYYYHGDTEISYFELYSIDHDFDYKIPSTWNMLHGKKVDNKDFFTKEYHLSTTSVSPVDLGYKNLFSWLADQHK